MSNAQNFSLLKQDIAETIKLIDHAIKWVPDMSVELYSMRDKCVSNLKYLKGRSVTNACEGFTLVEIGSLFGVSRERVRQLETSAMKKMSRATRYPKRRDVTQPTPGLEINEVTLREYGKEVMQESLERIYA